MSSDLIDIFMQIQEPSPPSPDVLSGATFQMDDPDEVQAWLDRIPLAHRQKIAKLRYFVPAVYGDHMFTPPQGPKHAAVFERIASELTGLRELYIYWDSEGPHDMHAGGGCDIRVLQAIGKIRGLRKLQIDGFYAKEWPMYLHKQIGLRVLERSGQEQWYVRDLARYQRSLGDTDVESMPQEVPWMDINEFLAMLEKGVRR